MSSQCLAAQVMCPVFRGDSMSFEFEFRQEDGSPYDISGMTLFFTAKQMAMSPDNVVGDIQWKVHFPTDTDSQAGVGSMKVPPLTTQYLIPGTLMHYDFQLVGGIDDVVTVGYGTFNVAQDITLATV